MNERFATLYNNKSAEKADLFRTYNKDENLTQQSDAASTDINVIMARYEQTGMLPQVQIAPLTGDFTGITDFSDAQQRILEAKEAFQTIPAKIRERFNNDPGEFMKFALDEKNLPEMQEMGLANKPQKSENPDTTQSSLQEIHENGPRYEDYDDRTDERPSGRRVTVRADLDAGTRREALREREELRPYGDREPSGGSKGGQRR